jgi:hypothetical protein
MLADATETQQANGNGAKLTRAGKMPLPSLQDLDRRTAAYRDATALIDRVIGERGGRDQVNVVRAASAETWAVLTTQLRALQVAWLNGGNVDWTEFTTIANARRREGEILGVGQPQQSRLGGILGLSPERSEKLHNAGGWIQAAGEEIGQTQRRLEKHLRP